MTEKAHPFLQRIDRKMPLNPRPVDGVKGYDQNEISFAHILFATTCPGSFTPGRFRGSASAL
jgi:hypothetical protein